MPEDARALFKQHDAFYEIAPHYVVAAAQRVHAGFDVDVYAARGDHRRPFMPPPREYAQGAEALYAVVKSVALEAADACSVEAFSFPASVTFGVRGHAGEPAAMFRIRIAAWGVDRAAGAPESAVLADVERQLNDLGIMRR